MRAGFLFHLDKNQKGKFPKLRPRVVLVGAVLFDFVLFGEAPGIKLGALLMFLYQLSPNIPQLSKDPGAIQTKGTPRSLPLSSFLLLLCAWVRWRHSCQSAGCKLVEF